MSCTVFAIPYALGWVITALIQVGTAYQKEIAQKKNLQNAEKTTCEEINIISEKHFIEKSFKTPFMDKTLLIKTLNEHGVSGLSENEYGQIKCYYEHYELRFERVSQNEPYSIEIRCLDTDDIDLKLQDLNIEYAVNVQEESYNSIVSKLKENNMQIENEEVYDDNTIVLTINLE